MDYTIVILGVIVVILIYILYRYFSTTSTTLTTKADLKTVHPAIPITNATSVRYAYGVWVYVNSFTGGNYKPIFQLPTNGSNISVATTSVMTGNNIQLYLDKTKPILYCDILTSAVTPQIQITPNFPLQTWVYVVISVDNNYADFYLNGKLIKSIQLAGSQTPATAATNIFIGDTGNGVKPDIQIAGFYRWSKPLNPQEVWSNYLAGNGNPMSSMISSFGMNVALVKDNVEQSKFALI